MQFWDPPPPVIGGEVFFIGLDSVKLRVQHGKQWCILDILDIFVNIK